MRVFAALAFSLLVFVATLSIARADDYGPHPDIRAIRAAIPALLASRMRADNLDSNVLHVDDVVVNGDEAVADWRADSQSGFVALTRRYGVWWLSRELNAEIHDGMLDGFPYFTPNTPGDLHSTCYGEYAFAAAADSLASNLGITQELASLAAIHLQTVRDTTKRATSWVTTWRSTHPSSRLTDLDIEDGYYIDHLCRVTPSPMSVIDWKGPYRTVFAWKPALSSPLKRFTGRAPTAAEFPPSPGANSVYFFSFEIGGTTSATVNNGSLDVWCPFVLDPVQRYSLTIDYVTPAVGPIYGTLFDNTLHFALPAFTIPPNTDAMGEIDFLPPRS